jgi:hypothetical protein
VGEGFNRRPEADESFHERNEGREVEDDIAREMMRLEFVKVKEAPEEVQRWEAKTVLKMGGENYDFAGLGRGLELATRNPAGHLFRYLLRPVQPVDLGLANV